MWLKVANGQGIGTAMKNALDAHYGEEVNHSDAISPAAVRWAQKTGGKIADELNEFNDPTPADEYQGYDDYQLAEGSADLRDAASTGINHAGFQRNHANTVDDPRTKQVAEYQMPSQPARRRREHFSQGQFGFSDV